jgi:Protein of unknown function (DUF3606)
MAAAKKKTARGRKQDRARVAVGQNYEVGYESKKTGRSASAVKKAVKKVGNSGKRVEKRLGVTSFNLFEGSEIPSGVHVPSEAGSGNLRFRGEAHMA